MNDRNKKPPRMLWLVAVVVGLVLIANVSPARSSGEPATPTPPSIVLPPSPVQLNNPGFESGLAGWQTWHESTGKPARAESLDYVIEPSFSIERNSRLVLSGESSLHIGRMYDPWRGGLKRAVTVTPRATVQFCVSGLLYASNRDFGHEASWASIDGRMQVGLLVGDGDWSAPAIAWSVPANPHDGWREMCSEATADETGRLTLFTATNYRGQAAKHLDAWWDDASLTVLGGVADPIWPAVTGYVTPTQGSSILLLLPSASLTTYTVIPAQMFMSAQGITLALSAGSVLPAGSLVYAISPTPTVAPTVAPTLAPTFTPIQPTVTPTRARPTLPPSPFPSATTAATAHATIPRAELEATPDRPGNLATPALDLTGGVLGLGILLVVGLGAGLYVIRHR